jgi:hypothetical protein
VKIFGARRSVAGLVVGLLAVGVAQLAATPARGAVIPVRNSIQQVFRAGTVTTPSVEVTDYAGEPLTLQAIDVGMTTAEPTIGLAPDGTAYYAGSLLDVDTDVVWGIAQTHTLRSTDGGITWVDVQQKIPRVDVSIPPGNADPMIWVDPATGRVFNIDLLGECSWLNYSDDKGATWISNPAACGAVGFNDHQTIGGGRPRGGYETMLGYPNALYYCVSEFVGPLVVGFQLQTKCGRSLDGGIVWTPTPTEPFPADAIGNPSGCGKLTGHVETDPDGRVFLPNGGCPNPWVAISEDSGDTWKQVNVGPIKSMLSHTAVASDSAGNLYYMTLGEIKGTSARDVRSLPFLSISTDHGATWGAPRMVAPPGVNNVNFPEIAAGDAGRIAITFPGTTQYNVTGSTYKKTVWNQYVVVSEDALDPEPLFLSATANDPADPVHRGYCLGRCDGWWDFIDIVVSKAGEAWAAGVDDCVYRCVSPGDVVALKAGRGIAIRQIGGPSLRASE